MGVWPAMGVLPHPTLHMYIHSSIFNICLRIDSVETVPIPLRPHTTDR